MFFLSGLKYVSSDISGVRKKVLATIIFNITFTANKYSNKTKCRVSIMFRNKCDYAFLRKSKKIIILVNLKQCKISLTILFWVLII